MWPFKRKSSASETAAAAVAEPPPRVTDPLDDQPTSVLEETVRDLSADNAAGRDLDRERRLLEVRHLLALRRVDEARGDARHPDPDPALPDAGDDFPEIAAADLTPELIRAGILRDGALLVRGLVPRDAALAFAAEIDRAFEQRELALAGAPSDAGYYEEWSAGGRLAADVGSRPWIREGGGVLAGDAPQLAAQMFALLERAGIPALVEGYLGEPGLISFEKTTLRKATPDVPGAWHQDGAFMGPVRALNLWLALSRCGDESPGLDVVPRRLEDYVTTQTDEAMLSYQVSSAQALAAAAPKTVVRPIFEPGDALFFDEKCLHQTGSDPSQPNPRYALESWFFGPSAFPEYVPIAV